MEISLALGGGGVRGLAHLGVLRVFEETGIQVKAIAGTSAGAIAGALYASGLALEKIIESFQRINQARMFARNPQDGPSLMGLSGVNLILEEALGTSDFASLKIPFACTTVDLNTSQEVVFSQGQVFQPVLASAAVPGVFPAQWIGNHHLIDGGVMDPVPVRAARYLRPDLPVVAVVLSPAPLDWIFLPALDIPHTINLNVPNMIIERVSRLRMAQALNIFVQSADISTRMLAELRLKIDKPEVIIRPCVWTQGLLDYADPQSLAQLGEEAAREALPEIMKSNGWSHRLGRKILPGLKLDPCIHLES